MKIVILDGYALNPGDLSYDCLKAFGELTVYEGTDTEEAAIARIGDAEIVLINKVPITESLLAACPSIRLICVQATGYNVVDCEACKKRGILVTNVPCYGTAAVAQFTMALLLELCHQIGLHDRDVHAGGWEKADCFCYWLTPQMELAGKTMGIIGFGRIGQAEGRIAKALGMNVIAFDIYHIPGIEEQLGIPYVEMDELLAMSDFVSVHAPAVDGGALISAENIAKMKDGVVVINTSRGTNVDEAALLAALESGKVRAAGLDVYADEPATNKALYSHPMVSCTPHIGAATNEAQKRIGAEIVDIIKAM